MAEQRDAREIITKAVAFNRRSMADDVADAILAALAAEGWSVERLEQVGWRIDNEDDDAEYIDGTGIVRDTVGRNPDGSWVYEQAGEPVYRVISPSTREAAE